MPDVVDGVDARYRVQGLDPGTGTADAEDLVRAVAAANDDKLLLKYAERDSSGRGNRPRRVFAPHEDLHLGEQSGEAEVRDFAEPSAHRAVGGLQLQHHLAKRDFEKAPKSRRAWEISL